MGGPPNVEVNGNEGRPSFEVNQRVCGLPNDEFDGSLGGPSSLEFNGGVGFRISIFMGGWMGHQVEVRWVDGWTTKCRINGRDGSPSTFEFNERIKPHQILSSMGG